MLSFNEFAKRLRIIEEITEKVISEDLYLEDYFDLLEENKLSVEEMTTSDVATVTKPIMFVKRKKTYESAPKSKEAEDWIIANKSRFKKEYGKDWEQIIYATAWKLFGKKKNK